MTAKLKAPFPYFGGKSRIAHVIWQALGHDVPNYVEPFAGSAAVLLGRPGGAGKVETINDADGFVANFWRAMVTCPEEVAKWADWPVNEADLHARHLRLVNLRGSLTEEIMGNAEYCDPKIAGWWLWGICSWIGSGWCSGTGPWVQGEDRIVDSRLFDSAAGQGINRQLPHMGTAGQGINRKLPHMGDAGKGNLVWEHIKGVADRMRRVRVACGDWKRVCSPSVTCRHGVTGVFLDPPYSAARAGCFAGAYAVDDNNTSSDVREWAIANGGNPQFKIVLAGYNGEHEMPMDWREISWKTSGGYGAGRGGRGDENRDRERLWLSPHCLPVEVAS